MVSDLRLPLLYMLLAFCAREKSSISTSMYKYSIFGVHIGLRVSSIIHLAELAFFRMDDQSYCQ